MQEIISSCKSSKVCQMSRGQASGRLTANMPRDEQVEKTSIAQRLIVLFYISNLYFLHISCLLFKNFNAQNHQFLTEKESLKVIHVK